MTVINVVLGLVSLLNSLWKYLDDKSREMAARKLVEAENLKADMEAIQRANRARDDVLRNIGDNRDRLRAPDADSRT